VYTEKGTLNIGGLVCTPLVYSVKKTGGRRKMLITRANAAG
jgi:hypothetical protein